MRRREYKISLSLCPALIDFHVQGFKSQCDRHAVDCRLQSERSTRHPRDPFAPELHSTALLCCSIPAYDLECLSTRRLILRSISPIPTTPSPKLTPPSPPSYSLPKRDIETPHSQSRAKNYSLDSTLPSSPQNCLS